MVRYGKQHDIELNEEWNLLTLKCLAEEITPKIRDRCRVRLQNIASSAILVQFVEKMA